MRAEAGPWLVLDWAKENLKFQDQTPLSFNIRHRQWHWHYFQTNISSTWKFWYLSLIQLFTWTYIRFRHKASIPISGCGRSQIERREYTIYMYITTLHKFTSGEGLKGVWSLYIVQFVFPINRPIFPVKCLLINKKTIFSWQWTSPCYSPKTLIIKKLPIL